MNIQLIKSGAQKKCEKKRAKLQQTAAWSYSLTNYFSCTNSTTCETDSSAELDGCVDETRTKRDAEGT